MKKSILLLAISLFCTGVAHAQKNSCELFVNAFNTASEGFPEWRGDKQPNNLGFINIDGERFAGYTDLGLKSGMIYLHDHLPSVYAPGKFFDKWDFTITSNTLYPGDDISWDDAKEKYEAYYNMQCQQIHDACTPQLKLSPVLNSGLDDGREKFVRYLFHPAYTWPEGLTASDALKALEEVAHIKITFAEKIFPKGRYEITYEISGIQYEP